MTQHISNTFMIPYWCPYTIHQYENCQFKQDRTFNWFHLRNRIKLYMLDVMLCTHKNIRSIKFTTQKNLIHFYPHHNNKIKPGVITEAFTSGPLEFVAPTSKEGKYIVKTFKFLQYPNYFLYNIKRKAWQNSQKIIHRR